MGSQRGVAHWLTTALKGTPEERAHAVGVIRCAIESAHGEIAGAADLVGMGESTFYRTLTSVDEHEFAAWAHALRVRHARDEKKTTSNLRIFLRFREAA
jgi:hypothetical protein